MAYLGNRRPGFRSKQEPSSTNVLLTVKSHCSVSDSKQLWRYLHKLGSKKIILYGDYNDIARFLSKEPALPSQDFPFEYQILFRPPLSRFLLQNMQKADSMLLPRLFCNKDYFKRHTRFGKKIFHFFNTSPEIYSIDTSRPHFRLSVKNPNDVDSVFLLFTGQQTNNIYEEVQDITDKLDIFTGTLKIETKHLNDAKIVILRRYYFATQTPVSRTFNYYDATAFAALQKWFKSLLLKFPVPISGVVYHLEEMFDVDQQFNGVSYSENLEKVLKGIKKTIAFYYANSPNDPIHNIFLSIVFKRYFNSMLRPRFNILSPQVHYLIQPDSSLAQLLDLNHQFIVYVNTAKYEIETPYFWKTLSSLKRAESQLFAETNGSLPVLGHTLFFSEFSLPEQKFHIDLLAQAGATQFWWKAEIDDHLPDEEHKSYLINKIKYANQIGAFLSRGLPVGQILVLYPSLDQGQNTFQKILQDLHFSGIGFELVNFDLFNSNHYCKIEDGKIKFQQKTYSLVLLPAIQVIPFLTLKKLLSFFTQGGQIAAVQKIPSQVELRDKQKHFEKIRKKLWIVEPDIQSITFLQSDNGGKSWYVPKIKLLRDFLQPYVQSANVFIKSKANRVLARIRETQEAFFVFVTNADPQLTCQLTIHSRKKAFPFYWDFKKQIQKPLHFWKRDGEQLTIPVSLRPMESKLVILQKGLSTDVWHIGFCDAEECHVFSPKSGTFVVQLRNSFTGAVNLRLEKGEKNLKVPVHIREKLNPILLSSDHWILLTPNAKQMIHLDDLPKTALTLNTPPVLQKSFVLRKFRRDLSYYLDLGSLPHACTIKINGQTGGTLWHHPFNVEISALLQAGENILEIQFVHPDIPRQENICFALPDPIQIIPYRKIFIQAEDMEEKNG